MIDTHCHLWFQHFDNDRLECIERAKKRGVHTFVQIGTNKETSLQAIDLAKKYEGMYASVGLHPTDHEGFNAEQFGKWLEETIKTHREHIVAVGETGIDYYHSAEYKNVQIQMLRIQAIVAKRFNLPLVIHNRATKETKGFSKTLNEAESDCLMVLDEVGMPDDKVLFHCFSGDRTMMEAIQERNWNISFSGVVTYPNNTELHEVVRTVKHDRFVVETDCPFLPPQIHRGKRNEPSFVVDTAEFIADLRAESIKDLERLTDSNAQRIFNLVA